MNVPERLEPGLYGAVIGAAIATLLAVWAVPVLAQDGTGPMPENAEARSYGSGWDCSLGYRLNGEDCVAIDVPENAYATGQSYGSGWACRRDYKKWAVYTARRSRCPRMHSFGPPASTGNAIVDIGRIARPACRSPCRKTPI
jgi:hypothetical protein